MGENRSTLRWMAVVTCGIVVLAALILAWYGNTNALPNIKIPTVVMPSPNAFDFFVNAGNSIQESDKIGYALDDSPRVRPQAPPAPPAPSTSGTPAPPYTPVRPGQQPIDHLYTLAEKDAIIKKNTKALLILRQGFAYPYQNPPARSFNVLFPHFAKGRNLARLLVLEGQTHSGHGDWGGALNSYLDAIRMGQETPRGGVLIAELVGIAEQAIGRHSAWKTLDHLNAQQARAGAKRMEDIMTHKVPFSETLAEEKWCTIASLMEEFRKGTDLSSLTGSSGNSAQQLLVRVRWATINKKAVLRDYIQFMDAGIADAKRPYAAPSTKPPMPTDPINQILLPVFDRARFMSAKCETENALFTVMLALRAYKLEHGQYPATLSDLAPTYLKALPNDPFALNGTFHYRRTGSKFILYSIGPDGKDDGGKVIIDTRSRSSQPDRKYWFDNSSKGDVVGGINIY